MKTIPKIKIIGAGLAGCEAAYQAANLGVNVDLFEMKPKKHTPAHKYDGFAELVCSNSLRSNQIFNAIGLLKEELTILDSLIMEAARATAVPAGSALAVDRKQFSDYVTQKILTHPNITVYSGVEVTEIDKNEITVIASGPLTSSALADQINRLVGDRRLYFFDAAAPIVSGDSIDFTKAYFASRYGKGDGEDYVNCPMTEEEYRAFYDALIHGEEAPLHDFDREAQSDLKVFEGCMPIEVMAKRGFETMLFGPLKPVGLPDPKTGKEPYAVVQLRRENKAGDMYNLVGFQTHLTFSEQKRIFGMIPGLANAEFLRYGVMHRNTYLDSPKILNSVYALKDVPNLFFAGQMTGVEGYIESTASGFVAGVNAALCAKGEEPFLFAPQSIIGSMAQYISVGNGCDFQPMNANFGIIPPLEKKVKGGKRARNDAYVERSLQAVKTIREFLAQIRTNEISY